MIEEIVAVTSSRRGTDDSFSIDVNRSRNNLVSQDFGTSWRTLTPRFEVDKADVKIRMTGIESFRLVQGAEGL
jgi:hypothetical protein